jgi:hypothetical protein
MYSFSAFDTIYDIQIEDAKAESLGLGLWLLVRWEKIPVHSSSSSSSSSTEDLMYLNSQYNVHVEMDTNISC